MTCLSSMQHHHHKCDMILPASSSPCTNSLIFITSNRSSHGLCLQRPRPAPADWQAFRSRFVAYQSIRTDQLGNDGDDNDDDDDNCGNDDDNDAIDGMLPCCSKSQQRCKDTIRGTEERTKA